MSKSPRFTGGISPYQSYQLESSSPPEKNALEDHPGHETAPALQHLRLTRPVEVKRNRGFPKANGVGPRDVDFPSFDSEFKTLYGGAREYRVGGYL